MATHRSPNGGGGPSPNGPPLTTAQRKTMLGALDPSAFVAKFHVPGRVGGLFGSEANPADLYGQPLSVISARLWLCDICAWLDANTEFTWAPDMRIRPEGIYWRVFAIHDDDAGAPDDPYAQLAALDAALGGNVATYFDTAWLMLNADRELGDASAYAICNRMAVRLLGEIALWVGDNPTFQSRGARAQP